MLLDRSLSPFTKSNIQKLSHKIFKTKSEIDKDQKDKKQRENGKRFEQKNELILVFLMYKQQRLPLILNNGILFEEVLKKLYKQLYTYQKQTFCLSNFILKNLLYKISGFETLDEDILFDFQFKYKRGNLEKQKFVIPFQKEEFQKTPFKIYTQILTTQCQHQFLIRNYSDGQWCLLNSIKPKYSSQNLIRKFLKLQIHVYSIVTKHHHQFMASINWFQTKQHVYIVSQYYPQSFIEYLTRIKAQGRLNEDTIKSFIFQLALILKQIVKMNLFYFKTVQLIDFVFCSSNGLLKINMLPHLKNRLNFNNKTKMSIDSSQSLLNNFSNIREVSDNFYLNTFTNILNELQSLIFQKNYSIIHEVLTITKTNDFDFKQILEMDVFKNCNCFKEFDVDFTGKLQKIVSNKQNNNVKKALINETKEEINKFFASQKNTKVYFNSRSIIGQVAPQLQSEYDGNLKQFKKEELRKQNLKTEIKQFINSMIKESNLAENFIGNLKTNNIKSINFYLKNSDKKLKRRMIQKIQNKYDHFLKNNENNNILAIKNSNLSLSNSVHQDQNSKSVNGPNSKELILKQRPQSFVPTENENIKIRNFCLNKQNRFKRKVNLLSEKSEKKLVTFQKNSQGSLQKSYFQKRLCTTISHEKNSSFGDHIKNTKSIMNTKSSFYDNIINTKSIQLW